MVKLEVVLDALPDALLVVGWTKVLKGVEDPRVDAVLLVDLDLRSECESLWGFWGCLKRMNVKRALGLLEKWDTKMDVEGRTNEQRQKEGKTKEWLWSGKGEDAKRERGRWKLTTAV